MKAISILACVALLSPLLSNAADDEREFLDGVEARNVGPFRGGRATVAVGVRQDPHVFYMGATGGVWKTTNAGATWDVWILAHANGDRCPPTAERSYVSRLYAVKIFPLVIGCVRQHRTK